MIAKNNVAQILFSLLTFFPSFSSFAQENFRPGYLVGLNGDTVRGFIDYRDQDRNISFKSELESAKTVHYPTTISGFTVADQIYISAIVETEKSGYTKDNLDIEGKFNIQSDTAFLQVLLNGEKSLYYYRNSIGKPSFYLGKAGSFELLLYKQFTRAEGGSYQIFENKMFLGQLHAYLNECPGIESKVKSGKYERKSLEKLFLYYYKCTNTEVEYKKETKKIPGEFGLVGGLSVASLRFKSDRGFNDLTETDFSTSTGFSVGFFFDAVLRGNGNRWSIYNEINMNSYKTSGVYEEYQHENSYSTSNITIGYVYQKLNTLLRYKAPTGNGCFFFNAGITNGLVFLGTNQKETETVFFAQRRTKYTSTPPDVRKYEQGLLFGLGSRVNKFSFEVRYEISNGISTYPTLKSSVDRFFFLIGYKF